MSSASTAIEAVRMSGPPEAERGPPPCAVRVGLVRVCTRGRKPQLMRANCVREMGVGYTQNCAALLGQSHPHSAPSASLAQ
eukprot:7384958-Prymnesium_polylepis.2